MIILYIVAKKKHYCMLCLFLYVMKLRENGFAGIM